MTITDAVKEVVSSKIKQFEPKNLMLQLLGNEYIKTVAIHGEVTQFGYYIPQSVVAVSSGLSMGRHAEDLLLHNIDQEFIGEGHHFILTSRIPCLYCMQNILQQSWKRLSLLLPSVIYPQSKWFDTQVKALAYMNRQENEYIDVIHYD